MSLSDEISSEKSSADSADVLRLRRQRDSLTLELAKVREELEKTQKTLSFVEAAEGVSLQPVKWLSPSAPKKSAATLMVMLSDLHLDEVVNPQEVHYLNAYNREIAKLRLQKWANNVVKLARHHLSGVTWDGVVILLGGDLFSGDIHEELAETNEDSMLGSLLYWSEQLASAVDMLTEEFGKCHVASVPGNHGRMTRKPRAKFRAKTNFDWLVSKMLERHFAKDRRVTFQIPEAADVLITVYGQGHLMTHGDQVHGGGGIGGIYPPIMRLRSRKAQRYHATGENFGTLWMGHWHQYLSTPSLIVNGSLKGWDEYAAVSNFQYEQPQQALAVVAPDRGVTFQAPVFCMDRKKEGW